MRSRFPRIAFPILVLFASLVQSGDADAQLLRRIFGRNHTNNCVDGQCQTQVFLSAPVPIADPKQAVLDDEVTKTGAKIGPSGNAAVRARAGNSCGSGSVCGTNLVLTNAHVVGTRVGREVGVDAVIDGETVRALGRVIMAAYSDKTLTDWAIVRTEGVEAIEPVRLSTKKPSGAHYIRGSPRCVWPLVSTNVRTARVSDNSPLWRWLPNSISGQSGSGVWSAETGHQEGLLTWSWGGYGAGQQTSEIYRQAKERSVSGEPRPDGLEHISDEPIVLENGFFDEGLQDRSFVQDEMSTTVQSRFEDKISPTTTSCKK